MRTARRVLLPAVLVAALLPAALAACSAAPIPAQPTPLATTTSITTSAGPDPATSTPPPATAAPVVVLDPGHNGRNGANPAIVNRPVPDGRGGTKPCNTTGTQTDAGYPEHAFTFDVATRVQQRLTAAGIRVVLTRPDDGGVGPCVDERGRAGEQAGAAAVVSIHADGSAPGNHGFHVALSDPPLGAVQQGPAHLLGERLRDALRDAGFPPSNYIGRDGISPRRDLAGLNLATRPTALVECANMRDPAEAKLVSSAEGRDRYAAAITAGILAFLGR